MKQSITMHWTTLLALEQMCLRRVLACENTLLLDAKNRDLLTYLSKKVSRLIVKRLELQKQFDCEINFKKRQMIVKKKERLKKKVSVSLDSGSLLALRFILRDKLNSDCLDDLYTVYAKVSNLTDSIIGETTGAGVGGLL